MHILYSRHNVRVYRFILRIVRDTTMAEDLVSQVFLDVWRTASQFEGPFAGFHLAVVDCPLQGADRAAPSAGTRTSTRKTCSKSPMRADTPEASLDPQQHQRDSARLRCKALAGGHREIINLVYYHEKSVEEAGEIIGIPQSTVKTRMFYCPQAACRSAQGSRYRQSGCVARSTKQIETIDDITRKKLG